jgi:hypothetical protein
MRRASLLGAVCGALLFTSVARADEATMDAVHLQNGDLYRGRVTENVPGDHVSITIASSGESKRIPWAEVDRVIIAETSVPGAPTAGGGASTTPSTAPTPATPPPMVGPRVRVHIGSSNEVFLYRRATGTSGFMRACTSPCDQELPINDTYRLAGNRLPEAWRNKEFHLHGENGGTMEIVVGPPSVGGMIVGGIILGGGATAVVVGLLLGIAGQKRACAQYCGGSGGSEDETMSTAGLVTALVGAAIATAGIVVFIKSRSTDVTMKGSGGTSAEGWVRKPMWTTPNAAERASYPVVFTARF